MKLGNTLDIEQVRRFLKRHSVGEEVKEALRFRLKTHLEDPTQDPLSNQVLDGYKELPNIIKTPCTILDAGCMSGFLYHFLKGKIGEFEYTGCDKWQEALDVGKEFAPEINFKLGDFRTDHFGVFDYIVLSNIPWKDRDDYTSALFNLVQQVKKKIIVIQPKSRIHIVERASENTPDD